MRSVGTPGFWKGKRVLVTGGSGFLGRHIVERLQNLGAEVAVPRRKTYNLTTFDAALRCVSDHRPEILIHSAAYYGGLGITMDQAGRIYYQNLIMGAHVMEAARRLGVQKFVTIGTACSYPGNIDRPLKEEDLWAGPLHGSVKGYGSVKKMLAIQGQVYFEQYGLNSIHLIPSNLYGPFDCYDEYRSHVVAALIKKFCDAHLEGRDVNCWGTGAAVREFLFIEDCADGVVLAAEKYDSQEPLNLGTGVGTSIRELSEAIATALKFRGRINWDATKPDGQLYKVLDTTRMEQALDWKPRMQLLEGLRQSIDWYLANREEANASAAAYGAVPSAA